MRARRATLSKPGRWIPAVVLGLLVAFGALAPSALAQPHEQQARGAYEAVILTGSPAPEIEAQFVSRINSLRASKGLSQLQVAGQLQSVARNWTEQMVSAGQISHNPNLGSEVSGAWTKLGENVGVGYDVDGLMQAFINSPAHYRNLVDPDWAYVGVGVTTVSDGRMYTTHNFMDVGNGAPPPAPAPAPAPTPPPPTQPVPTTAPPTTAPPTATPPAESPHPSSERVAAVLTPLRSLERG